MYLYLFLQRFFRKHQALSIFVIVTLIVFGIDYIFAKVTPETFINDWYYKKLAVNNKEIKIIEFAPEAWLGLLSLVLGTLIIVISVASQSTPKLIDLYTKDETSLFYIWYMIIATLHNMYLQLYNEIDAISYKTSMLLNTYVMLPIALLFAVPYILYILRYTKTSNVIEKIYQSNIDYVKNLNIYAKMGILRDKKSISNTQYQLFEPLNQLDNLLEYVSFKEPKGDIINRIGLSIQAYIKIKQDLKRTTPDFFKISKSIGADVSFKTMTGQFPDIEASQIFYEQKGFRLLGTAYQQLIENQDFDLASLCAYELSQCGRVAIECNDEPLIDATLIRFNTFIRFGIKHGLKNKEPRNLYNAIYHYSGFIHYIVRSKMEGFIRQSCFYLNVYVNEIYRQSREEATFIFLVDVFTWEFKRILIELHDNGLPLQLQKDILAFFLKIDNLSDNYQEKSLQGKNFPRGLRGLQISMALFYLRVFQQELAEMIIQDILEDHALMPSHTLIQEVNIACNNLRNAKSKFWEDTDRGNSNLYYSEDKEQINAFLQIFNDKLQKRPDPIYENLPSKI